MPSGGAWLPSDVASASQRPGFYANIVAASGLALLGGERGIVALPVTAEWGPVRTLKTITSEAELIAAYGDSTLLGTAYYAIREALRGGAAKIIAWRMAGAAAAKATKVLLDGAAGTAITLTAKYEGDMGNQLRITVATNAVDGAKKDLQILRNGVLLETFTGGTNAEIVAAIMSTTTGSAYVTAVAGGGTFVANISSTAPTGGNSGLTLLTADWTGALDAYDPQNFDVIAPVGLTDPTLRQTIFSWVNARRDAGQKVMLAIGAATAESITTNITNAATFNNQSTVYLGHGVTDQEGVVRNGADFIGRIAGLIAAKGTEVSLTFQPVTGIQHVESSPTHSQVKSAIAGGVLLMTGDGAGGFHIEKGINTLTTLAAGQTSQNKKIRIVRILDLIFNALTVGLSGAFIGQIENDEDGQASIIGSVSAFLETLSASRYIKPEFTTIIDPAYDSSGDKLFLKIGVKPVDSVDYIYATISVS